MGTAEFAVPALSMLVEMNFPIAFVVTQPDRPQGRGRSLKPSPVKDFALTHGLPIVQPESVRDDTFLQTFRQVSPDFVVLAAFGQLLPKDIINGTYMGCLNIHPSLLPKFRGAAPINWAIIRGEEKTGVTIMHMAEALDAGDIILQEETPIGPDESFGQLHDRLSRLGAELLIRALEMIMKGTALRAPQLEPAATYAPRLKKEDGLIEWERDAGEIVNLIRGLSPSPGAYTFLNGKKLKIFKALGGESNTAARPGTIIMQEGRSLMVATGKGYVHLLDLQMESKKRMAVTEFLHGYPIRPGTVLGL